MALTHWINTMTGQRLDRAELDGMRVRARRLYEVNGHLFEDELEALAALGVVPADLGPDARSPAQGLRLLAAA
jgi:hypothetical protein